MDLSLSLTIVFGIISMIGIIPVIQYLKLRKKNNVSLSFTNEQSYSLLNDDPSRLKISMQYNGCELINPMILFKGKITNDGLHDIDKNIIFKPLKIILNERYSILDIKLLNIPVGSETIITEINSHDFQFNWSLLKVGENIEFEILVEIVQHSDIILYDEIHFYKQIKFEHRITDLNQINKFDNILNDITKGSMYKMLVLITGIIILFGLLLTISSINNDLKLLNRNLIIYKLNDGKRDVNACLGTTRFENKLMVQNLDMNGEMELMTIQDFNKSFKIKKIDNFIISSTQQTSNLIAGIVILVLGCILIRLLFKIKKGSRNESNGLDSAFKREIKQKYNNRNY